MPSDIPQRAKELLTSEPRIAHLSTCHDERPHVAPLWYNYRNNLIEITTIGRKLRNLRENPHIAMSVQKDIDGDPQWGVSIQGTATIVEDDETGEDIMRRLNRRYGAEPDAFSENTPVRIDIGSIEYWEY